MPCPDDTAPEEPGLVCPACGFTQLRASESFCRRCLAILPEDWHAA